MGVRGREGGEGDRFFIENPRRGRVSRTGGAEGPGGSAANWGILGGEGLIFFFSGPKCPPSKKFSLLFFSCPQRLCMRSFGGTSCSLANRWHIDKMDTWWPGRATSSCAAARMTHDLRSPGLSEIGCPPDVGLAPSVGRRAF